MATAVDIYLRQISMTGGIPFSLSLPKALPELNADHMTAEEIRSLLREGYDEALSGRAQDAQTAFERFLEERK